MIDGYVNVLKFMDLVGMSPSDLEDFIREEIERIHGLANPDFMGDGDMMNRGGQIRCSKCKEMMENLGNLDGCIMTSHPPCWKEVHVCRRCKRKKEITVRGTATMSAPTPDLSDYEEQD
jgi:hypothetical protein